MKESIDSLIRKKAVIQVSIIGQFYQCIIHHQYSPNSLNRIPQGNIYIPAYCGYGHVLCIECLIAYVKQIFPDNLLYNTYQCPGCFLLSYRDSLLFQNERFEESIRFIMGDERINEINNASVLIRIPREKVVIKPTCMNSCGSNKVICICNIGHLVCQNCLLSWVSIEVNSPHPLKCPFIACNKPINIEALVNNLGNSGYLHQLKNKLDQISVNIKFCPKCQCVINLNTKNDLTTCACKSKICSYCGILDHLGYTCFYFVSSQKYQEIPLRPPRDMDNPKTLLDREYLKAK